MNSWKRFTIGLYDYYCRTTESPLPIEEFSEMVKRYQLRPDKYVVYFGYSKKDKEQKRPIYIGTTIQIPVSRWYSHFLQGKNLVFVEKFRFDNPDDMLEMEYRQIQRYHPSLNKITKRKQNLNSSLSAEVLESRKGNPEWCQCCLKRRVNAGYKYCYFCSKL